jgi:recombination protein RecA
MHPHREGLYPAIFCIKMLMALSRTLAFSRRSSAGLRSPLGPLASCGLATAKRKKTKKTKKKAVTATADDGDLADALAQISAAHGKGAVMKLGSSGSILPTVNPIRTGSLGLDQALGVGGLPRGRVVEVYGPESSGKTTLALHVIAEAQKLGGKCTFVDAEHALDPAYARAIGVDVDELYISQPDNGEQALEIADTLSRSGAMDVVVVDSVAALVPRAELEGEMGDSHMALQARLMSQALRKMTATLSRSNTLLIFINQIRSKIGVLFGSPEVTAGGNALKFYASVRMDIRRIGQIKDAEGGVIGNQTRVKIVKNKVAPPFRETEFDMMYGQGICRFGELIDIGLHLGVVRRSGAWYSFEGWEGVVNSLGLDETEEEQEQEEEVEEVEEEVAPVVAVEEDEDEEGVELELEGVELELDVIEDAAELLDHGDIWPEEDASNFAQGKDKARVYLQENLERAELLEKIILKAIDVRRKKV